MPRTPFFWFALIAWCVPCDNLRSEDAQFVADNAGFQKIVQPFVSTYCLACHGEDVQEGEFRMDQDLSADFLNPLVHQRWSEVVNALNGHAMPPQDETQPSPEQVSQVVDWVIQQMKIAELVKRENSVVLRRLNRAEYHNTIQELTGVDFDVNVLPQDPPAGGFDNNGQALTLSPLHIELYYQAALDILDQALVEGPAPPRMKWRIEPESGNSDANRVNYDGQRIIVNGGQSRVDGAFKVLRIDRWDRKINFRDFTVPYPGDYVIRIRAAGAVPSRTEVVASAQPFLDRDMQKRLAKRPDREQRIREGTQRTLDHFLTDRMYNYGPARVKLIRTLGGQPQLVDEFDVPDSVSEPGIYERTVRFTTEKAGVTLEYAYHIPAEIENFAMQKEDSFARPELWIDWIELEGPIYESWPPAGHRTILIEPTGRFQEQKYVRQVLTRFMSRAYRRPIQPEEISHKLRLFRDAREVMPFMEAVKVPLAAVLVSPHFLYLTEPEGIRQQSSQTADVQPDTTDSRPLDDFQLATRLSYFLWSNMPDSELFTTAASKQLSNDEVLRQQVDRLLADDQRTQFVKNFAGQWLGLREVGANPPAPDLYRRYDSHLEESMVQESLAFFDEILRNDLDAMNFIQSEFVVINERLARFYDIPGVKGDHFRKVELPTGVARGGVMTQASVLTITSNGTRTSPVKRGTWILKNVLGTDPGLPVANVGEIAPQVPGIDKATVRQRLEIHRQLPQCARCHDRIDPLGFALENFNASGEFRKQEGFGYKGRIEENDPLIDASSRMPDGRMIVGVDGLQAAILDQEELFLRCLSSKMMTYALGRELTLADQPVVDDAVRHMQHNGRTLRSLIHFIAASDLFRNK